MTIINLNHIESIGDMVRHWRQFRRLSQLDLALDADISTKHLSFIETGRSHPSREMLLRLATTLSLPSHHTNTLLAIAGYPPLYTQLTLDHPQLDAVRHALDHILSQHNPYPAVVTNAAYDILLINDGYRTLADQFINPNILHKYDNIYRLVFAADGLCPYFDNWPLIEQQLLNRLHKEALAIQDETVWQLYHNLLETRATPPQTPLPFDQRHHLPILSFTLRKNALALSFFSTLTTFGTAVDVTLQQLRIESLFPADATTKAYFSKK